MSTITELAPTLIDAGLSVEELRHELRPKTKIKTSKTPIAKKRYVQAVKLLKESPELSDYEIAVRVTCFTIQQIAEIRKEVVAVTKKLEKLEPIDPTISIESAPKEEE